MNTGCRSAGKKSWDLKQEPPVFSAGKGEGLNVVVYRVSGIFQISSGVEKAGHP